MVIPDIVIPQTKLIDFIKNKEYTKYSKVFVTRFEETGTPDSWTWTIFSSEEKQILQSNLFEYKDNTSWPTYFIWVTKESTIQDSIPPYSPSKHFLTMNNKQHYHRCYIMDRLNIRNLLDGNVYSWTSGDVKHDGYTWLKYLPKQSIQDNYDPNALVTQYTVPEVLFKDTAFSVVLESQCSNEPAFFTEKTFIPLYHKRPAIVLGNLCYWNDLTKLGFKKYPFIDYTFDCEEDITTRMEAFINEVDRIVNTYSPLEIHEMSKEVCNFNYNKMMEIYNNNIGKPKWLTSKWDDAKLI
jgi:hypothetical protein